MLLLETYFCISAERVEWQGVEHGAVLSQTSADLLQSHWQVLKHSVGLAEHVQPLREPTENTMIDETLISNVTDSRHALSSVITSSLGASCSTTGVSSAKREWTVSATLSKVKGTG